MYSKLKMLSFVFFAFFFAIPIPLSAQLPYPPDMPDARIETYKSVGDLDLNVWIFEPEGHKASQQRSAVVFFFGGGWMVGSPNHFQNQAKYLASRGMVAIAADYRVLERNRTTINIAVQDAK